MKGTLPTNARHLPETLTAAICRAAFPRADLPRGTYPSLQPWHKDASWLQKGSSVSRKQVPSFWPGAGLWALLGKLKGSSHLLNKGGTPLLLEEQRPRGKPNTLLGPLGLSEDRVRRTHSAHAECAGLSGTHPFQEAWPTHDFIVHTPPAHLGGSIRIETWMWISHKGPCSVRCPYNWGTSFPGMAGDSLGNATYCPVPLSPLGWA